MLTEIDLLRHGATQYSDRYCGSTNHPLSVLGWQQLWQAVKIQNADSSSWQYIVTSPLQRCAAFATELGRCNDIPVIENACFQEIHFGDWENRSLADLMQTDADALAHFWNNPLINTPPNAESLSNFNCRILSAWQELIRRHAGNKVLLVTHGGVIRSILCYIQNQPLENLLTFKVNHADKYAIRITETIEDISVTYHPSDA
ncbi:alpha-ribazole phosphatase [Nitrosomonas sp. PY1]|uniref:histidine phosphatase family protein n=1 Tax=Nitrosomonas sp. PY1 TaxID=1803906 RepID=UPI001FC7BEF1|nr:histidine phosphatase family protein [Nitrosomonas sp. PY1]GKS69909.1 alpha-ribazole phosphatase [Nitrosomonas sp. PY1]